MKIRIKVVSSDSRCFSLELKSSDTILSVKKMIKKKESVAPNQQTLLYNGKVLEDHKTLAEYNVERWSILHAVFSPPGTDNNDAVKMIVKMPCWKPTVVDVKSWYTAREIKALMESSMGFPLDQFLISYGGEILDDDSVVIGDSDDNNKVLPIYMLLPPSLVDEYSGLIQNLWQEGHKFHIYVCGCDREESLLVSKSNTVKEIKKMIEKFGIVLSNQQLLFHGKNIVRLEDEKTLGFYGIKEKSTLWVLGLPLKLYIKMPQVGDTISLEGVNSVSDIKNGIYEKMGIPCGSQQLTYKKNMLNDAKTLEAYNIGRNSIVNAIFRVNQIVHAVDDQLEKLDLDIVMQDGNICDITVSPWLTILNIKTIVESICDIPISVQELFNQSQMLKDWKTVSDYNMKCISRIYLEVNGAPVKLWINTPNGEDKNNTIVIEAKSSDTIDAVLDMIPEEQIKKIDGEPCLFLDDARLVGNKMLAHYGIESRSLLSLDRLIQINVTDPQGAITKVDLRPSFDIETVKKKLEETCGIPYKLQRLTYHGDELKNDMTLGECEANLGLWYLRWNCGDSNWSFFWPSYVGSEHKE